MPSHRQRLGLNLREAVSMREARPADAAAMLALMDSIAAEPDVDTPLQPGEFTVTVDEERKLIRDYAGRENSAFFTAWHDGKLLGMLNLKPSALPPGRHRAMLGMSVEKAARGRGVGRAMLEHAVDWARASRLLTRLELDVYTRNAPAIHLYDSVGFVREGKRRAPIWEGETPVDTYLMGLCFDEKAPVPYELEPFPAPPGPAPPAAADVTIRAARQSDADGAMELWRSIRADPDLLVPTAGMACPERTEAFRRRFEQALAAENSYVLIAEGEDGIVGTISARGHDRRAMCREALVAIGVADGWRGKGVGRRLLEGLEQRARAGGILRRLMLFVYADNTSACELYQRCGYEVEGQVRKAWFQHGRYYDELMMARLL